MFPVTITLTNAAQLNAVMAALAADSTVTIGVSADEKAAVLTLVSPSTTDDYPEPAMAAPGKPKSKPAAPTPPAPVAAPTASVEPATASPSEAAPAEPFDYATLAKAVNAAVPKHGKDVLLAIAAKHGSSNFKSLQASAWQAAYDDVVALG